MSTQKSTKHTQAICATTPGRGYLGMTPSSYASAAVWHYHTCLVWTYYDTFVIRSVALPHLANSLFSRRPITVGLVTGRRPCRSLPMWSTYHTAVVREERGDGVGVYRCPPDDPLTHRPYPTVFTVHIHRIPPYSHRPAQGRLFQTAQLVLCPSAFHALKNINTVIFNT